MAVTAYVLGVISILVLIGLAIYTYPRKRRRYRDAPGRRARDEHEQGFIG